MRVILSFAATLLSAASVSGANFHLDCRLHDLQKGDTVFCGSYEYIYFDPIRVDTFPVTEAGRLAVDTQLPHPANMIVWVHDANGKPMSTCFRGADLLAVPGDSVEIEGTVAYLGAVAKSGSIYDDPLVKAYVEEENILHEKLIDIYRQIAKYRTEENEDSLQKYSALYNQTNSHPRLRQLRDSLMRSNDNLYGAAIYASYIDGCGIDEQQRRLDAFAPEIRNSYFGQLFERHLATMRSIAVGGTLDDLAFVDKEGKARKLSDYRGQYLMIYHWGLCPGTIWANPRIKELYAKYHDRGFEIVGITQKDLLNTSYMDSPLADTIRELVDQPWAATVYLENPKNAYLKNRLYLSGVPLVFVVDPDGTVLFRGYYADGEDEVKKILATLGE